MSHPTPPPAPGWDRNDPNEWATPPRRPRSTGRTVLRVLAVVAALLVFALIGAIACQPSRATGGATVPNSNSISDAPAQATLTVEGSGKATVTYGNDTGGTNQEQVTLPWTKTLADASLLTLTGTSTSSKPGKITCTIARPGEPPTVSVSNGAYATCSTIGGL